MYKIILILVSSIVTNEILNLFENNPNMEVEQSNVLTYEQIREKIIKGSMDVNTRYPGAEDPSVLQLAIKKQDTELIDYLLKNNADVNIASESCEPALNLAIRASNPELVKKIIPLVADLNLKSYDYGEDYENWPKNTDKIIFKIDQMFFAQHGKFLRGPPKPKGTALELAITIGNMEIIELLLDAGASIDPSNGFRPLHWSIALNKYEIVEYLIKRGADINALCDAKNPVDVAASKGHKEILELLIRHKASIDSHAIYDATENLHFKIVKMLLDAGAELNPVKKCPPLFPAVRVGNCEFAEYLINRGANIDIEFNGKTAVHLAVLHGNQKMLELLIKYKANLDISTSMGLPIHSAIERDNINLVKILLKAGANLEAPTHLGSVSRFALSRSKTNFFDFFLDIGVDLKNDSYLDLINAGFRSEELKIKIKHHFVKLKAADFFVAPKNLQFIEDESFNDFYDKCYAEVELMKNAKINGTSVSFYDILHKTKQELAADLENVGENIGVTELELREKFPLYGGWICYRLEYEQKKNLAGNSNDQ